MSNGRIKVSIIARQRRSISVIKELKGWDKFLSQPTTVMLSYTPKKFDFLVLTMGVTINNLENPSSILGDFPKSFIITGRSLKF